MIKREKYLNRLIDSKDTEFIKVITGVRRSGKSTLLLMFKEYLLNNGVNEKNIIHVNFESVMYDEINNYKELYNYIKDNLSKGKNYVLLDEVQNVLKWEKAINGINVDFDVDVYITGSNAYLLSSELATLLSGRYIEIKIYPLSFREYLEFNNYDTINLEDTDSVVVCFNNGYGSGDSKNGPNYTLSGEKVGVKNGIIYTIE